VEDGSDGDSGAVPDEETLPDGDGQVAEPENPEDAVESPGQGETGESAGGSRPDAGGGNTDGDAERGDAPGSLAGTRPSDVGTSGIDQATPEPDAEREQEIGEPGRSTPVPGQEGGATPGTADEPGVGAGEEASTPGQETASGEASTSAEEAAGDDATAHAADDDSSAKADNQAKDKVKDVPRTGVGPGADGSPWQFAAFMLSVGAAVLALAAGLRRRTRTDGAGDA
jgi:hypothetical protein